MEEFLITSLSLPLPINYFRPFFLSIPIAAMPALTSKNVVGSGTGVPVAGETVTEPPIPVPEISERLESNKRKVDSEIVLWPEARAKKVKTAKVPSPFTPGIAPVKVSAVKVIDPPLSIVPGKKRVEPPVGKNAPSATDAAERIVGAKETSNWKA